jgi:hypothetical protein
MYDLRFKKLLITVFMIKKIKRFVLQNLDNFLLF